MNIYGILMALLVTSCMGLNEAEPSAYMKPDLGKVRVSDDNTLYFTFSSAIGASGRVKSCGFYYGMNEDMSGAEKVESSNTAGRFSSEVLLRDYESDYYVCSFISNGKDELRSVPARFSVGSLEDYVLFLHYVLESYVGSENKARIAVPYYAAEGVEVTSAGVCYGTRDNLTINGKYVTAMKNDGEKISVSIPDLKAGDKYFIRPFIKDGDAIAYAESEELVIYAVPEVKTLEKNTVTDVTAKLYGEVLSDCGKTIQERGFVWTEGDSDPTVSSNKIVVRGTTGQFEATIEGLEPNMEYSYRAYAKNSEGTAYGETLKFTTNTAKPVVGAVRIVIVTSSDAKVESKIISDGGLPVTSKGVVWSTSSEPTVSLSTKTEDGDGSGSFSSHITGLASGTKYYVRAYATNSNGTSYGEELSFTTSAGYPSVETASVTNITSSSATVGGSVISSGGSSVTERGIVWSTTSSPDISDNRVRLGSGTGDFSTELTDLSAGVRYYVRAYAKNSGGTSYGEEVSFITETSVPIVRTASVEYVTATSAISGGEVLSDGGEPVTVKGVVWGTSPAPTVSLSKYTRDGSGSDSYSSYIDGLKPGTRYYVRAYATNSNGTSYGEEYSFVTETTLPEVRTSDVDDVTGTSAVSGGEVLSDGGDPETVRGVVWNTSPAPTVSLETKTEDGEGSGSYVSNITGLRPATTYYVRAYATNSNGTSYGEELSFTTIEDFPIVETAVVTDITSSSAMVGGNVISSGGSEMAERGIVWGTDPTPTIWEDNTVELGSGIGEFSTELTGLNAGVKYYVRAYVAVSYMWMWGDVEVSYGEEVSFITETTVPEVRTNSVNNVTPTSAVSGGEVLSDGGEPETVRGVVWGTSPELTVSLPTKTEDGTGKGVYVSNITGLTPGTRYYVCAYATNSKGTSYGKVSSFTTSNDYPVVETAAVTNITSSSATVGGSVISSGGSVVTERGIVWSTTPSPEILDGRVKSGSGTGDFSTELTDLSAGVKYYVRAYAVNSVGISYGEEVSFITSATAPEVRTSSVNNVTATSAVSGGEVLSDGGDPETVRGVVWSTSPAPTVSLSTKTEDGTGSGNFVSSITGLKPATTYYLRAYATNSNGTSYGKELTFNTKAEGNTEDVGNEKFDW